MKKQAMKKTNTGKKTREMKEWTVMVYMAGDNNLAVDMAYALEQIKKVASSGPNSPNLFVYYDGNSPSIPTMYCDFSDPKKQTYVRSFEAPKKLYHVPKRQNENASDPRSVLNFVNWCVNQAEVHDKKGKLLRKRGRRAHKYALIFSGHTLGFQDIGLFKDESTGKTMKMNSLFDLLYRLTCTKAKLNGYIKGTDFDADVVKRDTTVVLGQQLDLLGFDACVMGMIEVGYQFKNVAKTMIASEGSVPSAGWTYASILDTLARECHGHHCNSFAEHFVREFIESQDAFNVGGSSVDMAAWDLSKLPDLKTAFDELSTVLVACFENRESRIYRQMRRVILQVHWKCQSYMFHQNVDIGDFCKLLSRECYSLREELSEGHKNPIPEIPILRDIQNKCEKVLVKLRETVIFSGFSGGGYQYSNGISLFFPWSLEGYEVSRKNYEGLWFVRDSARGLQRKFTWTGFLRKYLGEVTLRKFVYPDRNVPVGRISKYMLGLDGVAESGSKQAGQSGSKQAGQSGSKQAGQSGSKQAGQSGSKQAGQSGSKQAGQSSSKLGGSSETERFIERLKLYKNIESPWNVSGLTKKAEDTKPERNRRRRGKLG